MQFGLQLLQLVSQIVGVACDTKLVVMKVERFKGQNNSLFQRQDQPTECQKQDAVAGSQHGHTNSNNSTSQPRKLRGNVAVHQVQIQKRLQRDNTQQH